MRGSTRGPRLPRAAAGVLPGRPGDAGRRLLRVRFPDWRAALPAWPRRAVELPVGALLAGVRQAAVLREPAHARLLLRLEPGRLVLESRQAGAGRITVERAAVYVGEALAAEFNPAYLLELLRALGEDEAVRIELGGPGEAALFVSPGGYRHVLMTLRPATPAPEPVFSSGPRTAGGSTRDRGPCVAGPTHDPVPPGVPAHRN